MHLEKHFKKHTLLGLQWGVCVWFSPLNKTLPLEKELFNILQLLINILQFCKILYHVLFGSRTAAVCSLSFD